MDKEKQKQRMKTYYSYFNQYQKEHNDRINLLIPKGTKNVIREAAAKEGLFNKAGQPNISAYIFKLVKEDLKNKGLLQ